MNDDKLRDLPGLYETAVVINVTWFMGDDGCSLAGGVGGGVWLALLTS